MVSDKPLLPSRRTPVIDIARGWALFSVVVMNYTGIYSWNNHATPKEPGAFATAIEDVAEIVLGSKGWALLAVLFGYGFSVLLGKRSASGQSVYWFFIKRMLLLFVFAFVNSLFYGGDILNDYALMGLLLLAFHKLSPRLLLISSLLILLLLVPLLQAYLGRLHVLFAPKDRDTFYKLYEEHTVVYHIKANLFMRYKWMLRLSYSIVFHLVQLGCFLAGAWLQQSDVINKLSNDRCRHLKKVFWISLVLSLVLYFLDMAVEKYGWTLNEYYNILYPPKLCMMVTTTTGIMWLYFSGKLSTVFKYLQLTGRMTLTNYITQSIVAFILLICSKPNWELQWYFLTAILVYILQAFFSKWWLSKYNYGPLEWVWRSLAYGRWINMK